LLSTYSNTYVQLYRTRTHDINTCARERTHTCAQTQTFFIRDALNKKRAAFRPSTHQDFCIVCSCSRVAFACQYCSTQARAPTITLIRAVCAHACCAYARVMFYYACIIGRGRIRVRTHTQTHTYVHTQTSTQGQTVFVYTSELRRHKTYAHTRSYLFMSVLCHYTTLPSK